MKETTPQKIDLGNLPRRLRAALVDSDGDDLRRFDKLIPMHRYVVVGSGIWPHNDDSHKRPDLAGVITFELELRDDDDVHHLPLTQRIVKVRVGDHLPGSFVEHVIGPIREYNGQNLGMSYDEYIYVVVEDA